MDYWGGGGVKGMLAPLSNYWGGGAWPPPSSYAYDIATPNSECRSSSYYLSDTVLPEQAGLSSYYLSDTVLPEQAGLVNWDRRI